MKVLAVERMLGEIVVFDADPRECIRYSADDWRVYSGSGMDTYTLTDCAEAEAAYRAFRGTSE